MTVRTFMSPLMFIAATLCACAQHSAAIESSRDVAMMGDTQAELRRHMNAAEAAGKNPLFATVRSGGRTYVFSPYAQMLRTNTALIVRAYTTIYTFPLDSSTVAYAGKPVCIADLPAVELPPRWPALRERNAGTVSAITDGWNGLKDPWQTGSTLVPWTKGAENDAQTQAELKP